jgi:phospholipid/cholesterol/gamma-HCH transport system substrate-binding protein
MNFKFKHTEKIVGVFVFAAFGILIAGLVLIAVSRHIFVKTYSFKTKLSDADGLSPSTALIFKGYEIGKIKNFILDEDNNIDVELLVYKDFRDKIVKGSAVYRQVNPISGNTSLILLYPNQLPIGPPSISSESSILIVEGAYIPSLDMLDGKKLLEEKIIEKSGDAISILFEDARDFVSNLRQEVRLKKDSFQDFFSNIADFADSLAKNRKVFDDLQLLMDSQKGPVFAAMNRFVEISNKLSESVTQLNAMIENYKTPDGLMLKLLQVKQSDMDQTIQNINKNLEALHETIKALREQVPLLAEVLNDTDKTLRAVNNNPLLRGGIPKEEKNKNASKKKRMDIDK